jgi:hypothetical protein
MASDEKTVMNLVALQQKLIAAARRDQPSDRVPFAFHSPGMLLTRRLPRFQHFGVAHGLPFGLLVRQFRLRRTRLVKPTLRIPLTKGIYLIALNLFRC